MSTDVLGRRARLLAAVTIGYNTLEGVVAIAAGVLAGSTALIGFGLDSVVEVGSAIVIAWQFSGSDHEAKERRALRGVAISFFALAAYVTVDALLRLRSGADPEHSLVGIALAIASLIVMPLLVRAKRRTGRALGSASVLADSTQTLLCAYLSAVLLAGLLLNSLLGWGWADPLAALVIAAVALREGIQVWRTEVCC